MFWSESSYKSRASKALTYLRISTVTSEPSLRAFMHQVPKPDWLAHYILIPILFYFIFSEVYHY